VKLPADDAVHDKLTEWWYYSGHLQTNSGEKYSFHLASFLRRGTLTHTVFHGSLLDHQTEKRYTEQARTAGNPSDGRLRRLQLQLRRLAMQGEQRKTPGENDRQGFFARSASSSTRTHQSCTRLRERRSPACSTSQPPARAITPRAHA
jgi:hypothetical protein